MDIKTIKDQLRADLESEFPGYSIRIYPTPTQNLSTDPLLSHLTKDLLFSLSQGQLIKAEAITDKIQARIHELLK
jgi:hypothetical protein